MYREAEDFGEEIEVNKLVDYLDLPQKKLHTNRR
jgi:hypothetical protein